MKTYAAVVTAIAITFGAGYVKQHNKVDALKLQLHCSDCYEKVEPSEVIPSGMVECSPACFDPHTDTEVYAACERDSDTPEAFEQCLTDSYL